MIFAKLITGGHGRIHRYALAGTEALIELEIDLRDDVVGIEFFGEGESSGGFFQFIGALQPHAPEIQAARIKGSGQDGILILFAGHVKSNQQPFAPTVRRVRIGRRDRAGNGSERLRFHARPERLVPGNLIFVRQRRQERIFRQYF